MKIFTYEKADNDLTNIGKSFEKIHVHISPSLLIRVSFIDVYQIKHSVIDHLILKINGPRCIDHWFYIFQFQSLKHWDLMMPPYQLFLPLSFENFHLLVFNIFLIALFIWILIAVLLIKPRKAGMWSFKKSNLRIAGSSLRFFWSFYGASSDVLLFFKRFINLI